MVGGDTIYQCMALPHLCHCQPGASRMELRRPDRSRTSRLNNAPLSGPDERPLRLVRWRTSYENLLEYLLQMLHPLQVYVIEERGLVNQYNMRVSSVLFNCRSKWATRIVFLRLVLRMTDHVPRVRITHPGYHHHNQFLSVISYTDVIGKYQEC